MMDIGGWILRNHTLRVEELGEGGGVFSGSSGSSQPFPPV